MISPSKILALSILLGLLTMMAESSHAVTIVDTLNGLSTESVMSRPGFGLSVGGAYNSGPHFTLSQSTVITEIGGFLGCFYRCTPTSNFVVHIWPAVNG